MFLLLYDGIGMRCWYVRLYDAMLSDRWGCERE